MNPTITRLLMKLFWQPCVSWDGETFTIAPPAYYTFPQIQQRALIPLCFEIIMEDLGSEGTAQWHHNAIRIKPEKPLSDEARDKFTLAANNVCKAFLSRDFWVGALFGASAEHKLNDHGEEDEE